MWRFLVGLGLLLALAGLVVVALGVAIFVSSFGNTLIATGAVCLSGGIIVAAIGIVLRELKDLSARLDTVMLAGAGIGAPPASAASYESTSYDAPAYEDEAPAYLPPAAEPEEEPEPEPARAARGFSPPPFLRKGFERPAARMAPPVEPEEDEEEAPAAPAFPLPPAAESSPRLPEALQRGRVLGRLPDGAPFPAAPRARVEPPAPYAPPALPEADEDEEAPVPAPAPERPLDRPGFGGRSFSPPPRRADLGGAFTPASPAVPPPAAPVPPPAPSAPSAPAGGPEPTILKSGVVGGMAYTLYTDGSIQADLPDGTLRFASLQELREHVARTAQKPN